ncbi:hypothetical protein Bpfe_007177 [Biomphalaria pfeifferi]|uniref:Uncharacterized protein n=1 Tax=Biomphalaria pfeifferi TaxID=112525 RepID=A0AAD8BZ72_BIOPF|nr:hypothetical protein Bpfe_007177 [Biomphalaria pfeifferi]
MGYSGFSKLMNMLVMYSKSYTHHAMEIHKALTLYTKKILAETQNIVRNAYPEHGRKGTALRNVVDTAKNGIGKLSQTKIAVLQKHFSKALHSFTNVPEMCKAVWATFYHCCCPERSLSWCFFRRAEALGVPATSHQEMISIYLSPLVAKHMNT